MAKAKEVPAAPEAAEDTNFGGDPVEAGDAAGFDETGDAVDLIDFGEVDENSGSFEVMPRGIYDVIVDNCEYGISQRSSNPMWTWTFEVEEGEYANRKLFFHTVLTREQMGRTKKALMCIAPEVLSMGKIDPQQLADEGVFLGKRCRVRIDIRKYEGEPRNNVRAVLPPTSPVDGAGDFM